MTPRLLDMCTFVCAFLTEHVCLYVLMCVSMTTAMTCGRLSVKPLQLKLCNTHQPNSCAPCVCICVCGSGPHHHLYVVGCVSCWAMSASPSPPHHSAHHLPKLVLILQEKACWVSPVCATLCWAVPAQCLTPYSTLLFNHCLYLCFYCCACNSARNIFW